MKLDNDQLQRFHTEGFLYLPGRFSLAESRILLEEAHKVYQLDRPEIVHEASGVARTAFAAHTYNDAFGRLGAHPRLIEPVVQILGEEVYMHQYKVNAKA
ncbi:MAG: hypothetical protein QGI25_02520, partial [Arenicellales bacterium]|nr:hypothetical protein [Arenicellales bacterium]